MGVYNWNAPRVLGQEWVDIRNEDVTFSPSVDVVELGHTFTPTASRVLTEGRFYVKDWPPTTTLGQVMQMSVYKTGTEAISGPVQSVLIPCNGAEVTGSGFSTTVPADMVAFLSNPGDGSYINIQPHFSTGFKRMQLYFNTSNPSYAALLAGKRILKVELVQSISWNPNQAGTLNTVSNPPIFDVSGQSFGLLTSGVPFSTAALYNYAPFVTYSGASIVKMKGGIPIGLLSQATPQTVIDFGSINQAWPTPSWTQTATKLPWRYDELLRFEQSAGVNRYAVYYEWGAANNFVGDYYLGFAALRVTFCEENRVAYGGGQFGGYTFAPSFPPPAYFPPWTLGANAVTMYSPSFTTLPTLQAGQQYTVALSSPDIGDLVGPQAASITLPAQANAYPFLNGLRELASNPINTGVKVDVTQTVGETFAKETTHVLPQLSLHTSGGPLNEVHVYGRQAAGQVYGAVTVTQEILDSAAGGATTWPWVRFYARRFGLTTIPLTITGASQSTSISVAAFDALNEILDGWKQVDLRFATPPTMGAGTNPQFVWSAAGELAGNRWEILGAAAPALSGISGNLLNLAPPPGQLGPATYGQPTAGTTINMGWIPGISPMVSATTDDLTADAVILFSQDMPAVTGFAVTATSLPLTGVAQNCGIYPWYVPSSLSYNRITWSATSSSTPISGFAYYEIQRLDTLTGWQTIAQMTSPAASGFSDFEARVSLLTSYQIRAVNSSLFPGPWSSTVTITTAAPGVTGTGMSTNSRVMMFTSNHNQNGSRVLAYANAYGSGDTTDNFQFPEASFNKFQTMYGRDYQVAFRPTERGGSTFSRTMLIQAAAISPPTLPDFTSLRDLAWDSLPYVCVKDEDGNRWFANVTVPTGRVQMTNRQLYLADINVVEVTATAAVTVI